MESVKKYYILIILITLNCILNCILLINIIQINHIINNKTQSTSEIKVNTKNNENYLEYNELISEKLPQDALHPVTNIGFCRYDGPSGKEDYYNLPMDMVIENLRHKGYTEEEYPYWINEYGCKMLGSYIMVSADISKYSYGSIIDTSLGKGIMVDAIGSSLFEDENNKVEIDIATNWD